MLQISAYVVQRVPWISSVSSIQISKRRIIQIKVISNFIILVIYQNKIKNFHFVRSLGHRKEMDITIDGFHSWMWKGIQILIFRLQWKGYVEIAIYCIFETSTFSWYIINFRPWISLALSLPWLLLAVIQRKDTIWSKL